MEITRVTFHTQLPTHPQESAATQKQLEADQKQLGKDMASGDMIAQIIDFVDISVDAVAVATVPSISSNSSSVTEANVVSISTDSAASSIAVAPTDSVREGSAADVPKPAAQLSSEAGQATPIPADQPVAPRAKPAS